MKRFVIWIRCLPLILGAFLLVGGVLGNRVPTVVTAGYESGEIAAPVANVESDERQIFELINKERRKYNLDPLEWNSELAQMARSYSQKMARENFFSHYDSRGNSVADRAKALKIKRWLKIGENLFTCEGYDNFARVAVKGWMSSPAHRDNILEFDYNKTGIGVARTANGTIFVTQVFMQD